MGAAHCGPGGHGKYVAAATAAASVLFWYDTLFLRAYFDSIVKGFVARSSPGIQHCCLLSTDRWAERSGLSGLLSDAKRKPRAVDVG